MKKNYENDEQKIQSRALNTTQEIYEYLKKDYFTKIVRVEMDIHIARQTRGENKIQRYFNSTSIRNAFARWAVYGTYVNRFYSISELVKEMKTNRQTISDIVRDCELNGWINVIRKSNTVTCNASQVLVEKMEDYCYWRKDLARSIIGQAHDNLVNFEKLMKVDLINTNKK
jgi:hypothetical protein